MRRLFRNLVSYMRRKAADKAFELLGIEAIALAIFFLATLATHEKFLRRDVYLLLFLALLYFLAVIYLRTQVAKELSKWYGRNSIPIPLMTFSIEKFGRRTRVKRGVS